MEDYRQGLKNALLQWEKLRLLYNAIMLIAGAIACLVIYPVVVEDLGSTGTIIMFVTMAIFTGIGANGCFFAGPLIEVYLVAFTGIDFGNTVRKILFALGLGFSLMVVLLGMLLGLDDWY